MINSNEELKCAVEDAHRADDYASFEVAERRMAALGRDLAAAFAAGKLVFVDESKEKSSHDD